MTLLNPKFAQGFEYTTLAVAATVAPVEQLDGDGILYSAQLREDWCIGVGKYHCCRIPVSSLQEMRGRG